MTDEIWSEGIVPIILLPGEPRGGRLLDLIEQWTRSWLLAPAMWIRVEDVLDENGDFAGATTGRPPRVTGHVIGHNGRRRVDIFRELGRGEVSILRMLVVRWVEDSVDAAQPTHDERQDQTLEVLSEFVKLSQPPERHTALGEPVGTRVVKANLVFAPTNRLGGSRLHLLERKWDINIVVAPEDRPTPSSFDAFTRDTDEARMDAFILANVATAAGLWPGLNKSVYELDTADLNARGREVCVAQRVNVRAVLSDALAFRTAQRALIDSVRAESPLLDPLIASNVSTLEVLDPLDNEEAVKRMVGLTMNIDNGRLGYRRRDLISYRKTSRGMWASFKAFFGFFFDKLLAVPGWIFDMITTSASKKATAALHGEEGAEEVDASIDFGRSRSRLDRQIGQQAEQLELRKEQLRRRFAEPLPLSKRDLAPKMWSEIRTLIFSVLDGSTTPDLLKPAPQVTGGSDELAILGSQGLATRATAPVRKGKRKQRNENPTQAASFMPEATQAAQAREITMVSEQGHPKVIGDVGFVCPDPNDRWVAPAGVLMTFRSTSTPDDGAQWLSTSEAERWISEVDKRIEFTGQRIAAQLESLLTIETEVAEQEQLLEAAASEVYVAEIEYESLVEESEYSELSGDDDESLAPVDVVHSDSLVVVIDDEREELDVDEEGDHEDGGAEVDAHETNDRDDVTVVKVGDSTDVK